MDEDDMHKKFDEIILSMISKKREDNKAFLSATEYSNRISSVKRSKNILGTPGVKKSMKDYRMVKKYDVLSINGKERLIKPVTNNSSSVVYYITNEELFDIIHSTHLSIRHGGRNRMIAELKTMYCNITSETVMAYLRLCLHCQRKTSNRKGGFISKPTLQSTLNSRAQVHLIDMQSQIFNEYRSIFIYQDHSSKFVILRAMKSKNAEEVAVNLLDIYTTFGAPVILQSTNDREFINSVLTELHKMWVDVKIVIGKPQHSQHSESSVESTSRDIEEMLSTWMAENNSKDWPYGLKFIQLKKNRTFLSGIGKSPYEAMFSCPARLGLSSFDIPCNEMASLNNEEDLESALISSTDHDDVICESDLANIINATANEYNEDNRIIEGTFGSLTCAVCFISLPQCLDKDRICLNCKNQTNIGTETKRLKQCLEKQSKKIKLSTKFCEVQKGSSSCNVLPGASKMEDNMYELCAESDRVLGEDKLIKEEQISANDREMSLTEAAVS